MMTAESYLEDKLRQFNTLDLALVKTVYVLFGLLICALYSKLLMLDWWFYLVLSLLCACPLWLHLSAQTGRFFEKINAYLKSNTPANQVLLALSTFFFAAMLATLWPVLAQGPWWIYVLFIVVLAIKPMQKSWFW